MARKSKSPSKPSPKPSPKPSAKQSKAHSTSSKDLGLSDLRVRLNFLAKENEKLLNQIEKNRTELNNLNESIAEVGTQVAQRSAPFRQKLMEIDSQIHEVFQTILTGRKLGKKSRKDIETIYYNLQINGLISPKLDPNGKSIFENDDSEDEPDWGSHDRRSPHQFLDEFAEDTTKPDREELKKIRQLFLRLAEVFHPDKVSDEADKEFCTEVMKEINQAYQNGDLAKLLAIEKQQNLSELINHDSSDDLTRQCTKVEAENSFLKDQLDSLKQQLKITKKSPQGTIVAQFKKITKWGGDPIGDALGEIEAQIEVIEQLHKFAIDFRDRRITIKEFLRGPEVFMQQEEMFDEDEELFEFLTSRYNSP